MNPEYQLAHYLLELKHLFYQQMNLKSSVLLMYICTVGSQVLVCHSKRLPRSRIGGASERASDCPRWVQVASQSWRGWTEETTKMRQPSPVPHSDADSNPSWQLEEALLHPLAAPLSWNDWNGNKRRLQMSTLAAVFLGTLWDVSMVC